MLRFSQRSRGGLVYPTVLGLFGIELNRNDDVADSPTAQKLNDEMKLKYTPLTGWEGVQQMFSKHETTGISMELLSCTQIGLCSALLGFVAGGIENTKFTVREFKEQNQASIYENTYQAQRSVQDKVSKEFFKGGFRMARNYGSFIFCFSTVATAISVYRGKTSITDFTAAGAVSGAVFTINRGLLGAISGGMIGTFLGSIAGGAVVASLWAWGIDLHEVRYWQYVQYQKRVDVENKAYLIEREKQGDLKERIAFLSMKPEERETKSRILDTLSEVAKSPAEPDVVVPERPPQSLFRKSGK